MPLDDALKALDAAPDGSDGQTAPAPDLYADVRKALDDAPDDPNQQDRTVPAKAAALASTAYTPERAAQVSHLANRTGLHPDVVDKAYDEVVSQARMDAADYPAIQRNHAALLKWLTEPTHAAIAQDDLPNLRALSAAAQNVANTATPTEDLPFWSGVYKPAVQRAANDFGTWLLAGPAWVQQEIRGVAGIDSEPTPGTPLSMIYGAWDSNREMDRVRATYAPSWGKDLASKVIGASLDPRTVALPLKGAQLAVQGSKVLGEVATASAALKGAALVQGEMAGTQALQQSAEDRQRNPEQAGGALATAANAAVQSALGYFFGKSGGMIGPLRTLRETMFGANPMAELGSDIARQAVIGATQGLTSTTAEQGIMQGTMPTLGESVQAAAAGGIMGAALGSLNIHEALLARHHLENLRGAAALQFGNKLGQLFDAAAASKSAQRSPEEVGKLIDSITQDGIHHVYLQAGEWASHFQAKGLDPAVEAEKAGLGEEYARASALNGDMQMPVRAAVGMAMDSQNPARLATLFRQDPAAPNVVEAAKTIQEAPQRLAEATEAQKLLAATEIQAGRGAEDENGQIIREEVAAQLAAAGRPAAEADRLAEFYQRAFTNWTDLINQERTKAGGKPISPTDLYDQFKLRINSQASSILNDAASSQALDRMLNNLRERGPVSPEERALREALHGMGLDATSASNQVIRAAINERAKQTVAQARSSNTAHGLGTESGRRPHGQGRENATPEQIAADAKADKEGADAAEKRLGPEAIQKHLELSLKDMQRVPLIEAKNVPYAMGMDKAGTKIYKDPDFATKQKLANGKVVETINPTKIHEITETRLMNEGLSYEAAHDVANAVERAYLRSLGYTREEVDQYERDIEPNLRKTRKWTGEPPADLNPEPYISEGETDLLRPPGSDKPIVLHQRRPADERAGVPYKDGNVDFTDPRTNKIAVEDFAKHIPEHILDSGDEEAMWRALALAQKHQELGTPVPPLDLHGTPLKNRARVLAQGESEPLGTFSIDKDLASVITLWQGANRSTAFHESAHFFLEVMGTIASRDDAPARIKEDFAKVMEWSGYGSREQMLAMQQELGDIQERIGNGTPTDAERARLRELSEPHEKFARGFEAYLMEGKAPAKGLRRAFAQIKAWMKSVYRDITALGVELNPEIRGVFDRMLASEDEIKAAKERLADKVAFTTAEEGAFTPEQFQSYKNLAVEADRIETEALEHRLMAVEQQTRSRAYKADRAALREQIGEQVAQERVYQALSALQDGKTWDGRPLPDTGVVMKIFKSSVQELLTPEEMMRLPGPGKDVNRGRSIMTTDTLGLTADDAARLLGYGSGHELLTDLMEAADRETRIEALVDDRLKAKYPDPMDDRVELEKAAAKALHANDIRGQLMDMERAAVERMAAIKKATDEADAAESKGARADRREQDKRGAAQMAEDARKPRPQPLEDVAKRVADDQNRAAIAALGKDERQGMRVAAADMIARAKISTINPDRFAMAERRSAIAFSEAMAKRDYTTALQMKRKQMMNAELARAAYDAVEQVEADRDKLAKAATDANWRQTVAKAGGWEWTVTLPDGSQKVYDTTDDQGRSPQEQARIEAINSRGTYERTSGYIDQIDQILERYDLRQRSNANVRRRESLQRWIERNAYTTKPDGTKVPNGLMSMFPESVLAETMKPSWKSLTVAELHDVRNAVDSFEQMARNRNRLQGEFAKMEIAAQATEMAEQIAKAAIPRMAGEKGILGKIAEAGSELVSIPRIALEMDGHQVGPVQRLLIHPQERALNAEHAMLHEVFAPMEAAEAEWGKRNSISAYVQKKLPGNLRWQRILNGKPVDIKGTMSLREKIVLLGHYGNPEGRQRLQDNHGWGEREIMQVLSTLDAKDIAFANKMVDAREAKWSDVKAQAEKYNGFAPPKVTAIPVELPNGTYKGGYQRIYYDGDLVTANEQLVNDVLSGKDYLRTDRPTFGSAEARVNRVTDKALSLDMADWKRATYEMVHALTHQDMLANHTRLLAHPALKAAIITHWGNDIYRQFGNQVNGIATGNKGAFLLWQKAIGALSSNTSFAAWAFNQAFALPHVSQWPKTVQEVGLAQTLSSTVKYLTNPAELTRQVKAMSPSIKARHEAPTSIGSNIPLVTDTQEGIQKAGMMLVSKLFWESHDVIAFDAAYTRHMAESGNKHEESLAVANQAVSNIAGSSAQKDIPDIRRNALMKFLTNRMLFDLANYNSIAGNVNRIRLGLSRGSAVDVAAGAASILASTIIQGLLWNGVYDLVTGRDLKKELESWETPVGVAKNLAMAAGSSLMRCLPVIRDIAGPFMGEGHAGNITGTGFMGNIQRAGEYLHTGHHTPEKTAKAVMTAASVVAPLPATEFGKVLDGLKYNNEHPSDNPWRKLWHVVAGAPPRDHK